MEPFETPSTRRAIPPIAAALLGGALLLLSAACATAPGGAAPPRETFPLDPREEIAGPFADAVGTGWAALERGDPAAAIRDFEAARDGGGGGGLAAEIGWIQAAVLLGRFEDAAASCREALTRGEATVPLLVACGEASGRGGKPVEGYRLYRRAVDRTTGHPKLKARAEELRIAGRDAMAAEARVALEEKRWAEARERIAVAIDLAPDQPGLHALAGEVEEAAGEAEPAFRRYREAFELDPKNTVLAEKVGDLAVKLGDPALAVTVFDALARNDPKYREQADEARLEFRVSNWPEPEREAARSPRLSRVSAAALVWWMFPEVREARVSAGVIASDAVSRRDTRAFARALALGLLDVDRETHRGNPDATLTRAAAARFLLRLAGIVNPGGVPCLEKNGTRTPPRGSAEALRAAEECGLWSEGESEPPSGSEFIRVLDKIRALGGGASRSAAHE